MSVKRKHCTYLSTPIALREGPQWEEYCRVEVLLHVRHRDIQELTEDGTIAWSTLYNNHIKEINADPIDLLGLAVDNTENEMANEEEELFEDDDEQDEFRPDWMLLAEMGPKSSFDCSSDLGSRDMDRNHDWINDPRQRYNDLTDIDTFLSRNSRIGEKSNVSVDYQTLNNNQKKIFKRVESHYQDVLEGRQNEPLRIIVMGTAGTGKTYLIEAIRSRLQEMTEIAGESKSPVAVLAPTGVAALNIDGITIHSGLSIPIVNDEKRLGITGERLMQLQDRLKDIRYIIIDEKSMVGRRMLALIDMWLRQAFPEHNNEPFGGRSIIMFGDFGQLPPVLDLPMYNDAK